MRVALAVDMSLTTYRGSLEGIGSYAREARDWTLDHCMPSSEDINWLLARKPDGLIVGATDPGIVRLMASLPIPVVNIGVAAEIPLTEVRPDEQAVGEMAATYFLRKGYRNLGYAALRGTSADDRSAGFVEAAERAKATCFILDETGEDLTDGQRRYAASNQRMERWLMSLPRPAGILCSNDRLAWILTETCALLGICVPQEMSVLGIDNDATICALSKPPLSSIQLPSERIGYEAARLLEERVKTKSLPPVCLRIPPIRVVERRSTDALAIEDSIVSGAIAYMRENLKEGLSFEDLAKKFGCSRRTLERLFDEVTGCPPAQAWKQLRVREAQRLLAETDLSIEDVAYVSGFAGGNRLSDSFRKQVGVTPTEFRKRARP